MKTLKFKRDLEIENSEAKATLEVVVRFKQLIPLKLEVDMLLTSLEHEEYECTDIENISASDVRYGVCLAVEFNHDYGVKKEPLEEFMREVEREVEARCFLLNRQCTLFIAEVERLKQEFVG